VLLIHFPLVRSFLQSTGEWECHDSALGPVRPLCCDDVTDGVFNLISHNKEKVRPKRIKGTKAPIALFIFS